MESTVPQTSSRCAGPVSGAGAKLHRILYKDWRTRERAGRTARTNAPDHSARHGLQHTGRTVSRRLKPLWWQHRAGSNPAPLSVAIAICPAAATWFPVAAIACGDRRDWLPSATRRSRAQGDAITGAISGYLPDHRSMGVGWWRSLRKPARYSDGPCSSRAAPSALIKKRCFRTGTT
jgi:hypothetical protein